MTTFLGFTNAGSGMVYGYLVTGKPLNINSINETIGPTGFKEIAEALNTGDHFTPPFMFQTLSIIYFFSFCVSI